MKPLLKSFLALTATLALGLGVHPADAKGCIKGAIVGGAAGSMAGHGKMGAAAGCAVGHHKAGKKDQQQGANPPGR